MNVERVVQRLVGLFVRWGLLEHPYGREYARQQYTLTGRHAPEAETRSTRRQPPRVTPRSRAVLVGTALALLSLLAAGVLAVGT
jgi:hypothetical protein